MNLFARLLRLARGQAGRPRSSAASALVLDRSRGARVPDEAPLVSPTLMGGALIGGAATIPILMGIGMLTGNINRFDRIAFTVLAVVALIGGIAVLRDARRMTMVGFVVVVLLALYLTANLVIELPGAPVSRQLGVLSMTLSWAPLIYMGMFLVCPLWLAIGMSLAALALINGSALLPIDLSDGVLRTQAVTAVVNYLAAQIICIAFLVAFGLLRASFARTRRAAVHLAKVASTDPLTGLSNRRELFRMMNASNDLDDEPASLILLDIDQFKAINDAHGHLVGDDVLRRMAGLLTESARPSDRAARWGGEEFLILSVRCDVDQATAFAHRLQDAIHRADWPKGLKVTASIGVTELRPGEAPNSAFDRVDAALYRAKQSGRDRIEPCGPVQPEAGDARV